MNYYGEPFELIQHERKLLELRKYAAQLEMGQTALNSMTLEAQEDFLSRNIIHRMEVDILSDKIAEDTYKSSYSYSLYTTPWQFYKARHMPKWFKKRFPVQRKIVTNPIEVKFTRYATYPKANIAIQKDRRFFEVVLGGAEYIQDEVTRVV